LPKKHEAPLAAKRRRFLKKSTLVLKKSARVFLKTTRFLKKKRSGFRKAPFFFCFSLDFS